MCDQPIPKTKAAHAFEKDGAPCGFWQYCGIAEAETRITDASATSARCIRLRSIVRANARSGMN
jgi:hypothetical protein